MGNSRHLLFFVPIVCLLSACNADPVPSAPDAGYLDRDSAGPTDLAMSDGAAEDGAGEAFARAQERYVRATCAATARCSPFVAALRGWADEDACVEELLYSQERMLESSRVRIGVDDYDGCAASLEQIDCIDYRAGRRGVACRWSGTVQPGEACLSSPECADGYCLRSSGEMCGTCHSYKDELESCSDEDRCDVEQHCVDGRCRRRSVEGEACDERMPCLYGLTCVDSECMAPAAVGEPCSPFGDGAPDCSYEIGTFCNRDGVCEERQIVTDLQCLAEPLHCAPGLYCEGPYCAPEKGEGAACRFDSECASPLHCVDGACDRVGWEACQ